MAKDPTIPAVRRKKTATPQSQGESVQPLTSDPIPPEHHGAPDPAPMAAQPAIATGEKPHAGTAVLPMIFGGVLAGAIGFGIAQLTLPPPPAADTTLADQVAALQAQIQPPSDLGPITQAIADLDRRLSALETAAPPAAALPSADMDALRAELTELTDAARAELDAARAQADMIAQNATRAARDTALRGLVAQLQLALDSGAPIDGVLTDLEAVTGAPAPDALRALPDPVPTLTALQAAFAPAARAALRDARAAGVAGEQASGLAAFLRAQFQVRSVAPQTGASVDATLSRAQAALDAGQLADVLAEIDTLPDAARSALGPWRDLAQTRVAAMTAIDDLSAPLRDN